MLEYAVAAGLAASGADVYLLHVTTTPSVSYIVRQDYFDCGVMITASHNPFYDNGIKVINSSGEKLEDSVAALCEAYIDGNLAKLGIKGQLFAFAHHLNPQDYDQESLPYELTLHILKLVLPYLLYYNIYSLSQMLYHLLQ